MAIGQSEQCDISIDSAAGSLTALEGEVGSGGIQVEYETDAAIALSDDIEGHTLGHRDGGEFNTDGVFTRTRFIIASNGWRNLPSTTRTVNYEPDGNELHAFESILTGWEISSEDGSTASMSETRKVTGAITLTPAV